ncbi:MAG: PD40 domain-containing protein [Nitrospirae bacterium]|nr:PD40 domain-containing protein [Nitrospirota bacterium]
MKAVFCILAIIVSAIVSASSGSCAEDRIPSVYSPVKVDSGVAPESGRVSWHNDNTRIAYISDAAYIYDTRTGAARPLDIAGPHYLSWAGDNHLVVLYREEGRKAMCLVDARDLSIRKLPVDIEPDAVFPVKEGAGLLIFSSKISARALWADYHFALARYDISSGSAKKIYEATVRLPVRNARPEDLKGLVQPDMNPFDFTALLMEAVKPPVVQPYVKIVSVDYITGKANVIGEMHHRGISVSGSWSPDGRRFAFGDETGLLKIYDLNSGEISDTGHDIRGRRPSWNPEGSQIFYGGHVVTRGVKDAEMLVPDGASSIGIWSPDGTGLALISSDGLRILRNFRPSFVPPDGRVDKTLKAKLLLLKEIYAEGLITGSEYEKRYKKLMSETKELR